MYCLQCGAPYTADQRFCTACGRSVVSVCPSCGEAVRPDYAYCTKCGQKLGRAAAFTPQVFQKTEHKTSTKTTRNMKELMSDLHMIGVYRDGIPASQQGWCNVLGLYVWYRGLDKYTHGVEGVWLKAGSKYRTQFEGWTDYKDEWDVEKYKPGEWEKLVKPTLQIAKWLYDRGGLKIEEEAEFRDAIDRFKKQGRLDLH